jgi:hypothetical protein
MVPRISALAPAQPGIFSRALMMVSSFFVRVEPVELVAQRFNFLPHRFRWRGDLRSVRAVARTWEQPQIGLWPARRYFEVICGQGTRYILFQDIQIGTWHVSL